MKRRKRVWLVAIVACLAMAAASLTWLPGLSGAATQSESVSPFTPPPGPVIPPQNYAENKDVECVFNAVVFAGGLVLWIAEVPEKKVFAVLSVGLLLADAYQVGTVCGQAVRQNEQGFYEFGPGAGLGGGGGGGGSW